MKESEANGEARVLCWPAKLLSEEDLRRHLTCQNEILLTPKTIVTPLALDHLRGKGVRIRRQEAGANGTVTSPNGPWGYAEEKSDAMVATTLAALQREGVKLIALPGTSAMAWARAVAQETTPGGVIFCGDPAFICCVANKVSGVRASAVMNGTQAKRARLTLGANLFAVEMPGRTFHELRQIVRTAVGPVACPPEVAKVLQELDGHAHR